MEISGSVSWDLIGRQLRSRRTPTPRQAPARRKSKTERQLIDKVLNLDGRGYSYDQTAEELGLTKGQVAGILFRSRNSKPAAAMAATTPPPKRWEGPGLDRKTLTREQVDPNFKGDAVQFATQYGHVHLHTKTEIEENKRQEVLRVWLAAVTDHQQSARALANVEVPNPDTLRQWLAKPGKAERLQTWLTAIEAAYRGLDRMVPSLAVVGK